MSWEFDIIRKIERIERALDRGANVEVPLNAWTTYTPTVTSTVGTITSYTAAGSYRVVGKSCLVTAHIAITNVGTGSGTLRISLPFANAGAFTIAGWGMTGLTTALSVWLPSTWTDINVLRYDAASIIVPAQDIYVGIEYAIA